MASKASNNSVCDLRMLMESMRDNNTLAEYPDLLNIFFHYLDMDPPSEYITRSQQQTVQLCAVALDGVTTAVLCLCFTLVSHNPMIVQKVSHSWASIWKWIDYFHTNAGSAQLSPLSKPKLNRIVLRVIGHFFLFSPNAVTRAATATSRLFPILAEIWVWQSRRDPTRYEIQEHHVADCLLATQTISALKAGDSRIARFIVESLDGDLDKMASVLLKYVRMTIEGGQEWITGFSFVIATSGLLSEQVPGLMHALLAQHSMIDITRAYATFKFSSIRTPQFQVAQLYICLSTCLSYIFKSARWIYMDGPSCPF
jgi:hypothetical protein